MEMETRINPRWEIPFQGTKSNQGLAPFGIPLTNLDRGWRATMKATIDDSVNKRVERGPPSFSLALTHACSFNILKNVSGHVSLSLSRLPSQFLFLEHKEREGEES